MFSPLVYNGRAVPPHPNPLPQGPQGEGEPVAGFAFTRGVEFCMAWQSGSLSPRKRVGVRGNSASVVYVASDRSLAGSKPRDCPRQQRFGQYTRSLMKGLGVPVMNKYGLRPATVKGTNDLMPATAYRDLDKLGLLEGVTTFNFHPHLPHYEVTTTDTNSIRLLARQPINLERPHPFVEEGNKEFNCFLWMPPADERPGDIVLADSTIFTTLFGVSDSLKNFWRNLATMRMG